MKESNIVISEGIKEKLDVENESVKSLFDLVSKSLMHSFFITFSESKENKNVPFVLLGTIRFFKETICVSFFSKFSEDASDKIYPASSFFYYKEMFLYLKDKELDFSIAFLLLEKEDKFVIEFFLEHEV